MTGRRRLRTPLIVVLSGVLASGCESPERPAVSRPAGDRVQVVEEDAVCSECEVVTREVAVLGDPRDPSSIRDDAEGRRCVVGRLSTGEYVMAGPVGEGEIFVYDTNGELTGTIGQRGEGPGELGPDARVIVGPGDTLFMMDDRHGRLQVFTSGGEFVRSFRIPGAYRPFALLSDRSFLFVQVPMSPEDPLFHVLDSKGEPRAACGSVRMRQPGMDVWTVSGARGEGFWAADVFRYELHRWKEPEDPNLVLVRDADWFPPFPPDGIYRPPGGRRRDPPPPLVGHLNEDDQGRLWTHSWVLTESWEPYSPTTPQYEWARRSFDTIIEVVDPERGQVLARSRHDERFGMVCGSELLYTIFEDERGYPRVRILESEIVEPSGSP